MNLTIFDLDHTLLKGNSSYHFGFYLYKHKFFSWTKLIFALADYGRHKCLGMSIQKLHEKTFKRLFKGHSRESIQHHVENFLCEQWDQLISPPVVQHLRYAQQRGDHILILSSSPDFMVSAIAKRLQVDGWHATLYQTDQNQIFTAIDKVLNGEDKAQIALHLAQLNQHTIQKITVYSDSYLDLPILKIADRAVGVNPDAILKRVCLENGWEIVETKEA